MRRNDRKEARCANRCPQIGQHDVEVDRFAAEVPIQQGLVLRLFDDRLDQRIPVLLDDRGFGFIRFPRLSFAAAIVSDATTQQVDGTDDMAILDQRHTDRLNVAKDPAAASDGLLEVSARLFQFGHRDRPRHVDRFALPPQQPGRVIDLIGGRHDKQHSVGGP